MSATRMHNPPHPGEVLKEWLADLNMSTSAVARHLGVSRVMLSRILNGHASVTADMDVRLSQALGTSAGFWLRMQTARDLWEASERARQRAPIARLCQPLAA